MDHPEEYTLQCFDVYCTCLNKENKGELIRIRLNQSNLKHNTKKAVNFYPNRVKYRVMLGCKKMAHDHQNLYVHMHRNQNQMITNEVCVSVSFHICLKEQLTQK